MKENVLDVLMYLFESYADTEEDPEPEVYRVMFHMSRSGTTQRIIDHGTPGRGPGA